MSSSQKPKAGRSESKKFFPNIFGKQSQNGDSNNQEPAANGTASTSPNGNNSKAGDGSMKNSNRNDETSTQSSKNSTKESNGKDDATSTSAASSSFGSSVRASVADNTGPRVKNLSLADGLFDRYWRMSDVLCDSDVKLGWAIRIAIIMDVAREMKEAHDKECAIGDISLETIVVNDKINGRIQDNEKIIRASTSSPFAARDILGFGLIALQIWIHKNLFIKEEHASKRDSALFQEYEKVCMLYSREVECSKGPSENDDIQDLCNDFDFTTALDTSIRNLFKSVSEEAESANVPSGATQSLEELIVQCCAAMRENRPNAEGIIDWLGSVADDIRGALNRKEGTDADLNDRDDVVAKLQLKDIEIMGEVTLSRDNKFVTGKKTVNEDGYETDDSYQPPKKDKGDASDNEDDQPSALPMQRRKSRLSLFIDEVKVEEPPAANAPAEDEVSALPTIERSKSNSDWSSKKAANKRASIKPTQASRFSMMWGGGQKETHSKKVISPEDLAKKFNAQERLSNDEVVELLVAADAVLRKDPNMPILTAPVVVVGDLHGQYFDLQNLLKLAGPAKTTKYLFLGDYVDRGDWSCECFFFIMCLKVHYPQNIFTLRGNHECDAVSSYFGFKEECEMKYGRAIFNRSVTCFQCMPIAGLVETGGAGRFLCCHGGISPHVTSLDQIEKCDRFAEPGMNGFLCDILWSDPVNDTFDDGQKGSLADLLNIDYMSNPARGCSYRYGYRAIISFLATNQLNAIIRAHEVQQEGYKYHFQDLTGRSGASKARIMPPVITVFSAPNYCGRYGNKGAFMRIHHVSSQSSNSGFKPIDLLEPVQFDAVEHPEPIVLENETVKQTMKIEKQLPFMPTTFSTFLAKARELVHEGEENDEADPHTLERIPAMERHRRESAEKAAEAIRKRDAAIKDQMQGTDLTGLLSALGVDKKPAKETSAAKAEAEAIAKASKVKQLVAKYQQAAASDSINEMHPELVKKKMDEAKARLAQERRVSLKGIISTVSTIISVSKSIESSSASSSNDAAGSGEEISISTNEDNDEVNFSPDEILCLRMLFLMVDRHDKGTIDADDLVAWSAAEGMSVPKSEADLCIEALDQDKDQKIGFVDYLTFAATLKLRWRKANEATKVINELVKKPMNKGR